MFILKGDVLPPISFILESRSFWLFSFIILKDFVMEPVVVKTVSYFKESVVILNLASALVIKLSFLQEAIINSRQRAIGKKQWATTILHTVIKYRFIRQI